MLGKGDSMNMREVVFGVILLLLVLIVLRAFGLV